MHWEVTAVRTVLPVGFVPSVAVRMGLFQNGTTAAVERTNNIELLALVLLKISARSGFRLFGYLHDGGTYFFAQF